MQGYENYDLQEEDPYLLSGSTCLINRLGITNTQALNEAEAAISKVAFAELIANPIEATFNLKHMCRIHHYLFSDIYEWAGQLRQTEISKGGQLFCLTERLRMCLLRYLISCTKIAFFVSWI